MDATTSDSDSTRSLVTGGTGFVGLHLTRALVDRGDDVTVLDVGPPEALGDLAGRVRYVRGDIRDGAVVREAVEGQDCIFHNASVVHTRNNRVDDVWAINLGGTRNILGECARQRVGRLVYVSSASAVYEGEDIEHGDETMPYSRVSQAPYADSKIAAEREVLAAHGVGGLRTCAIRPHVIFGPGDTRFVPTLLERARAGKLKFGVGREQKLSDFTYVDNLIDALLLSERALLEDRDGVGGRPFFVTNGEPMAFWDFVGRLLKALGFPPLRGMVPYRVAWTVAAIVEALDTLRGGTLGSADGMSRFAIQYMCTHHYFSIERARARLDWEPSVSIDEGIARTAAHLRATGQL